MQKMMDPRNGKDVTTTLHAVMIPFPAQGHVTPFLQLAKKLVGLGFRITFINTTHNHVRMMKSRSKATLQPDKDIDFVSVSDGLPDDHPRLHNLPALFEATLGMGPAFEELFINMLRASSITCVIRDVLMVVAHERARKLGIPVVGFATPSAISMHCVNHFPTLVTAGILPIPPPPPHAPTPSLNAVTLTLGMPRSDAEAAARQAPVPCLPGASPTMRVDDLPTMIISHDLDSYFPRFFRELQNPLLPACECILVNSFQALEGDILDAMAADMNSHIYAVGPLIFDSKVTSTSTSSSYDVVDDEDLSLAGNGSSSLWEEDLISLAWLDHQAPNSVLFVSFGSLVTVTMQQMQEFVVGLEQSGHAFLWVIRPDVIGHIIGADNDYQVRFSEFLGRTNDRALLVPWAPQTAVLSHPSVAAFLTHCGWNSIIECISSGVPMLGWPRIGDQYSNCHYITHVWKIGLRLQTYADSDGTAVVPKEEIAQNVKKIMASDKTNAEVANIRTNSRNLQKAARTAVRKGGSSQIALMKFVELIGSGTTNPPPVSQNLTHNELIYC